MFSLSLVLLLFLIGYLAFVYGKKMLGWNTSSTYQSKFTNSALSFIALLSYIILYKEDLYIRKLNFFIETIGVFVLFGVVHSAFSERIKNIKNYNMIKKFSGPIKGVISTIIGGIPFVFPSTIIGLNNTNSTSSFTYDIYFSVVYISLFSIYIGVVSKSNFSKINRIGASLCILSWLLSFITGLFNLDISVVKGLSVVLSGIGLITIIVSQMLYEKLNRYNKYGVRN
jgi:hypothetical protein